MLLSMDLLGGPYVGVTPLTTGVRSLTNPNNLIRLSRRLEELRQQNFVFVRFLQPSFRRTRATAPEMRVARNRLHRNQFRDHPIDPRAAFAEVRRERRLPHAKRASSAIRMAEHSDQDRDLIAGKPTAR